MRVIIYLNLNLKNAPIADLVRLLIEVAVGSYMFDVESEKIANTSPHGNSVSIICGDL
ncbi:MAG: hypothetical protein QXH91_00700 [Candidatus Bathyarchaeia archaeon]